MKTQIQKLELQLNLEHNATLVEHIYTSARFGDGDVTFPAYLLEQVCDALHVQIPEGRCYTDAPPEHK